MALCGEKEWRFMIFLKKNSKYTSRKNIWNTVNGREWYLHSVYRMPSVWRFKLLYNTIYFHCKHRSMHCSKNDFAFGQASMEFIAGFVDGSSSPSTPDFNAIKLLTIQHHILQQMQCNVITKKTTPLLHTLNYERVKFCKMWYTWSSHSKVHLLPHILWSGME